MDPGTILAVTSLCGQLAGAAASAACGLIDLRARYGAACRTVDLIVPQVNALKAAMPEVSAWLHENHNLLCQKPTYIEDLHASVRACCLVIEEIEKHLQIVRTCPDFLAKCKVLWQEDQVRDWHTLLNSQVSAFTLHLQVLKLNSPAEQESALDTQSARDILSRARDDVTSFTQRHVSLSPHSCDSSRNRIHRSWHTRFGFDGELLESRPYRKVSEALHRRRSSVESSSVDQPLDHVETTQCPSVSARLQVGHQQDNDKSSIDALHDFDTKHFSDATSRKVEGSDSSAIIPRLPSPYSGTIEVATSLSEDTRGPLLSGRHFETNRAEVGSLDPNLLSTVDSTDYSNSSNVNDTPMTSIDPETSCSRTDGIPPLPDAPSADSTGVKLMVSVEINSVGREHHHIDEFESDPLVTVCQVIQSLRDRLLQDAFIQASELLLVTQNLSAKSNCGIHTMGLTALFLHGVLDEVRNGTYSDPCVFVKYAVSPNDPQLSALQQDVRKELDTSAIKLEARSIIPLRSIEAILSRDRIQALIARNGEHDLASLKLAIYIQTHALKLFTALLLVDVNLPMMSAKFLQEGVKDELLPFRCQQPPPPFMDQLTYNAVCSVQWTLLPAVIKKELDPSGAWPAYDSNQLLPFADWTPIASGGYGKVYRVKIVSSLVEYYRPPDKVMTVAVKRCLGSSNQRAFDREVQALMQVKELHHSHIIELISAFRHGSDLCLVFPMATMSLRCMMRSERVLESKGFSLSERLVWIADQMRGLADALAAMLNIREFGTLYHHDLKPENILLFQSDMDRLGMLRISDFGLSRSKAAVESQYQPYSFDPILPGTTAYAAPECVRPQRLKLNTRAEALDVWSLGVVFCEILIWMIHGPSAIRTLHKPDNPASSAFFGLFKEDVVINRTLLHSLKSLLLRAKRDLPLIEPRVTDLVFALMASLMVDARCRPSAKRVEMLLNPHHAPGLQKDLGRLVLISDGPRANDAWAAMRSWIKNCTENHDKCRTHTTFSPEYLLEVATNDDTVRLVKASNDSFESYVTLSYVWGGSDSVSSRERLTSSNSELYFRGFPERDLPVVVRDAVRVARSLDYGYLWVDALCIPQDDPEVMHNQILQMDKIYSNASLTIVAASSSNYNETFLNRMHREPLILRAPGRLDSGDNRVYGHQVKHSQSHAWQSSLSSEWFSRGWTFQEALLSRRLLIFSHQEVLFACRQTECCECNGIHVSEYGPLHSVADKALWYRYVEEYTRRRLTFESDALLAIAGIASRFSKLTSWTYAYGLWLEGLENDLCWSAKPDSLPSRPKASKRRAEFPSWSWVGWNAPVNFHHSQMASSRDLGIPNTSESTIVSVKDSRIRIRTSLIEARMWVSPEDDGGVEVTPNLSSDRIDRAETLWCSVDYSNPQHEPCSQVAGESAFRFMTQGSRQVYLLPLRMVSSGLFVLLVTQSGGIYYRVGCAVLEEQVRDQFSSIVVEEIILG